MTKDATPEEDLERALQDGSTPALLRVMIAALTGATGTIGKMVGMQHGGPAGAEVGEYVGNVAGGAIGGVLGAGSQKQQDEINRIVLSWLKLQQDEIKEIGITLTEVVGRLDMEDEQVRARIESPEYLRLIKKCFRDWSAAESEEKRVLVRNLLINAAGAHIVSDSVVFLFVRWIDDYSENHFQVVSAVYNQGGITRQEIWARIYPNKPTPKENSADADLFKLLIRDLSTGGIVRQHREVDPYTGEFLPKKRQKRSSGFASAFDDGEQYELTELGREFVHYTMGDRVQKIASTSQAGTA